MRIFQLVIVSFFALILGIGGCGGNVIVDVGTGGSGSGGASNGSNNTGTSVGQAGTSVVASTGAFTTSGGPGAVVSVGSGTGTCSGQSCAANSDGTCVCEVTCNNQVFQSRCYPEPGGAVCECAVNDMVVGKCQDTAAVCDVFMSCCAQFFNLGG